MDTADWAQEAEAFLQDYHRSLSEGHESSSIHSRYFPEWDTSQVLALVQGNPLIRDMNLRNLQAGPFELFETVRGWQPLLRRLPNVKDSRIITLARRNLQVSLTDPGNLFLVSRQQWTLIECLRHAQGLYQDERVAQILQQDMQTSNSTTGADNNERNENNNLHAHNKLKIATSEGAEGRHVVLDTATSSVVPGDVLHQAVPFVATPFDFGLHSACFHCANDLLASVGASLSSMRDLALQCSECQVSSLAYCSVSCRQEYQARHARECAWIPKLVEKCQGITTTMAPFKVLLVLRAVLLAKERPEEFAELLKLEAHVELQAKRQPEYAALAGDFAQWMVQEILTESDLEAISAANSQHQSPVEALVHIFLSIPINAMSLGPAAVGLFPGIPSMFNHSCLETVTHSWDANNRLVFRAVEPLQPGEECCISYVSDLHLPTAKRTEALQEHKFFLCQCARCQSPDELGRAEAIGEWKQVSCKLENQGEGPDPSTTIALFRKRVELAETLFPSNFVTKGLTMEELAHSLMDSNDASQAEEASRWLIKAKEQYATCRGPSSKFVERVTHVLDMMESKTNRSEQSNGMTQDDDDADDNADLKFAEGWHSVLLEVKTYEALEDAGLEELANRVKAGSSKSEEDVVRWASGHRAYEIGYGIRSLILACEMNYSVQTPEELIEILEVKFDDDVQHVDIVTNTL